MTSSIAEPIDLLHHTAEFRIQVETVDAAIVFAFAGSGSTGLFQDALASSTVAPSDFEPDGFHDDLFLREFIRTCFVVRTRGKPVPISSAYLLRLLARPPRDSRSLHLRREVLSELRTRTGYSHSLEASYERLCRLRDLLEGSGISDRYEPTRRQLEILAVFRDLVQELGAFHESRTALSRLGAYASRVRTSESFVALVDLLRFDAKLASVDFQVSLGADGRVRELHVTQIKEDDQNQFVLPPWRRWLARFELFLRGYRFSEGELMARLLDAVFEGVRPFFAPLVQLLGDLEFYLGALNFAARAEAAGLSVSLPTFVEQNSPKLLRGLWNPLLLGAGIRPVPCQVALDRADTILLVTGPNSGGKTRLLQSIAYCQLLGQVGLFVPAESAQLRFAPGLVVSLIQEASADQTEGRLGTELKRIRWLFERVPKGAMVLLDELCSGTNPSEGEEIFELVIRMLTLLEPQAFITTHFLAFAGRLKNESTVTSLRFLQVELGPNQEPTYQFVDGVAKTSLAGRAAERLGVTGDQLLALIRNRLPDSKSNGI
jgi:DNA mismatch repair protein MutS2